MHQLEFSLINTAPLTFKVRGMIDDDGLNNGTLPSYLTQDMIVTLVSGKWPLVDYHDCGCHTFVFQKICGTQFSLLVDGFTWHCSLPKEKQQEILNEGKTQLIISLLELPTAKAE